MGDTGDMLRKSSEKIICAFCRLEHRVYTKKEVSVLDVLVILSVTGVMALAIWGGPDLRSLLIFMSLAFVMQVFLRVRYRESIKCPHCGFDPIVYKQDPERAAQRVTAFMENRKDNPEFLLRAKPKIEPIYLKKEEIEMLERAKEANSLEQGPLPEAPSLPPQSPTI